MNAPTRIDRLRAEIEGFEGSDLVLSYVGSKVCIERVHFDTGEAVMLAEFIYASSDEQQYLIGALENVRFLLGLVDAGKAGKQPNYAAQAAMLCDQPPFWIFLGSLENSGPTPRDKHEAAKTLRTVLGINSRMRLNDDPAAAQRWNDLHSHFTGWKLV